MWGKLKKRIMLIGMECLLSMAAVFTAYASDNGIEQIYVNKPDIVAYYRAAEGSGEVQAYLGGEELTLLQNQPFSETGENINFFVLADISGSIQDARFQDIKESLTAFLQQMRPDDRMVLYSFGDEVARVLSGDEDRAAAGEKIAELGNHDKNTLLFDAIEQAADIISEAERGEQKKWVLIIISDGEDYADNTKTAQSATNRLITEGIPAYTIAVENDMGYSEQVLSEYQGNFSNVAEQTGGIAWTPGKRDTMSHSVLEALEQIEDSVLGGYRAGFQAANNKISNQEEQFVLKFPDGSAELRSILINRNQPDLEAPAVTIQEKGENAFQAVYSEPVSGAGEVSHYLVALEEKNLGVAQVVKDETQENAYLLVMKEDLKNAVYHITISNVTDDSNERNPLAGNELDVEVTTMREADYTPPEVVFVGQSGEEGFLVTFSEEVQNAENNGNYQVMLGEKTIAVQQVLPAEGEANTYLLLPGDTLKNGTYVIRIGGTIADVSPEANTIKEIETTVEVSGIRLTGRKVLELILRWWPIVLTVVVVILMIAVILYTKKIRDKNLIVIDGEVVKPGEVQRKVHVVSDHVPDTPLERKGKPVILWLSNGRDEPKRIEHAINGSCFVGRSSRMCEIYCDDPMMSKQHFNLSVEKDGGIYITDLGSTNGTAVNGVRIQGKRRLEPRDEISAGSIRFVIEW